MSRSVVTVGDRAYTVSGLEPRDRYELFQAIVVVQLVDDLTGAPITGPVQIVGDLAGLLPRVGPGGFVGLVGVPSRVLPILAGNAHVLEVVIGAAGYESHREQVPFPAQAGFAAADLGVLRLRRTAVSVAVSTYALDLSGRTAPLDAAAVTLAGWWARTDQLGGAPRTTPLLGLAPGLSTPRASGADLDVPALTAPAEPERLLVDGVAAGSTRLRVSNTGALTPGDLVGLDLAEPDRAERVEVSSVVGGVDLLAPTWLTLRWPLRLDHAADSSAVRLVAPAPVGPAATTSAAAFEGDRTVEVSTLTGLATGAVVRVSGGGAGAEYRVATRYEVSTNTDGVGRLAPLSGVAAVVVNATKGALGTSARHTLTQPSAAVELTLT